MVGKHALSTAISISIFDQVKAFTSPQVGSFKSSLNNSASRSTLAPITKPPNRNIPDTAIFWRIDMCSCQTFRTGRNKIQVSVTILGMAFPMKKLVELMQCAGIDLSQKPLTGVQVNIEPKMQATAHARTNTPMMLAATVISLLGNKE